MISKDSTLTVRVNGDLKARAEKIAKKEGTNLSKIITAYLLDTVQRGEIPYPVLSNIRNKNTYYSTNLLTIPFIKTVVLDCIKKWNLEKCTKRVILFGSYARNEQTIDSDVDLRMEIDNRENISAFDIGNFYEDVREGLTRDLDLVTSDDSRLDSKFLENIKKDGIILYERDSDLAK